MKKISKNKKFIIGLGIILLLVIIKNNAIITRGKLAEYNTLDKKIRELEETDLNYYEDNREEISKYLDLKKKYESVEESFNDYKNKYPDDLSSEINTRKDELNKYYKEAVKLENKLKEEKSAKAKKEQQIASSNSQGNSSSQGNSYSNSNGNYYSNGGNSSNYSHGHRHNNSSNKHIGKSVYIANGNSYYHAISNCKYLEGAKTQLVTLTSGMRKYECNCWTNPVPYKKPASNHNGGNSHSGGRTVYIASGNSYYHKTPYCKHLRGASTRSVGINNVGGKHPCNCIKY